MCEGDKVGFEATHPLSLKGLAGGRVHRGIASKMQAQVSSLFLAGHVSSKSLRCRASGKLLENVA